MRGSPFTFSTFALGLNVLDSPYTLKQGEARKCRNVVSTPRGAVRKRYGSSTFVSGLLGFFPALGVTDSLKRVENPLSNAGKWTALGHSISETFQAGRLIGEGWSTTTIEREAGAYWNVAEQTNPAVSAAFEPNLELRLSAAAVVCCIQAGATYNNYSFQYFPEVGEYQLQRGNSEGGVILAGGKSEKLTTPGAGDQIGITVRGGIVTGWHKAAAGEWERLLEVTDATYTKGFCGIYMHRPGLVAGMLLKNFSFGEAPASPAEAEFTSVLPCKTSGGNFLIAASGTKLFSVTENGELTEIGSGFKEGKRWSLVQAATGTRVAKGPVYLSNGFDEPQSWAGTAKGTATTAWTTKAEGEFSDINLFRPKYLVYFGNRVWAAGMVAGSVEGESALRWSGFAPKAGEGEVADPTDWPKANVLWLDKDDGSPITGLGVSGPYLLVFKAHKTWVVYDLNEGENRRISDSTGCVAARSVVETPLGTFFLSPDQGVFVTNGAKVQEMSRNVRPILQGTDPVESRSAKLNELENAAAGYLNGHYYLSYMAQDGSMKTLDYDTLLKSWWIHDLAGNQWVVWEPTSGSSFLYTVPHKAKSGIVKAFIPGLYTDSGANYVGEKFEVTQKNGETITVTLTAFWASCWEPFWQYFMRHRFQQPQIKKRIRTLFVDAGGGANAVEHKGEVEGYAWRNFGVKPQRLKGVVENADIATAATYTPKPGNAELEYQAIRFYSLGTGRVWCFMFGNQTGEPFEVDTYAADLYFRKA